MLEIRKKGVKHFRHYEGDYEPYSANDIKIIFDGNIVKLRSVSGRVIFDKEGYLFSDVRIYDDTDGSVEESYPNIESFQQRLINLGYPFMGNQNEIIYAGTTWNVISGDPTTNAGLVSYVESETEIIDGGTL
jgi:hypothetical protein